MSEITNISWTRPSDSEAITLKPSYKEGLVAKWHGNLPLLPVALQPKVSLGLRPGSYLTSRGALKGQPSRAVKRKVTIKGALPYQPVKVDEVTPAIEMAEVIVTFNIAEDAPADLPSDLINLIRVTLTKSQVDELITEGRFPH